MSETRIPGKHGITVISDTWSPYGTIGGTPAMVEDPTQWATKTLTEAQILKREGWTPKQLRTAQANLGFPLGEEKNGTWFHFFGPNIGQMFYLKEVKKWEASATICGLLPAK